MPCFSQDALELTADLAVHAGQDAVEEFDDGDLRAQPPPDRAELEPDDAGADRRAACSGTLSSASAPVDDTMRFSSISMPLSRATSEPVAMTMFLVSSVCVLPSAAFTSTLPGAAMRPAVKRIDLVLLEQEGDALDVAVDALVLELHHGREIELRLADARCPSARTCARPPRTARTHAAAPWTGCSRR